MPSSKSRRDFLHPKTFGKLVSTVTGGERGAETSAAAIDRGWLCRARRAAMATRFEILFESLDAGLMPVAQAALELIDELESQLTVYRDTSELCAINRTAWKEEVVVVERLFDLLMLSRDLWEETEGCFDIAVHSMLAAWGMFRGPRRKLLPDPARQAHERSGMQAVQLDPAKHSIRFMKEGIGLNLAAIGKGYALERAAEALLKGKLEHFLIHGGHSSVLARGSSTWESGWLVGIVSPIDWDQPVAQVRLENTSLSTSAIEKETLAGDQPPHVLDPRTGFPVESDLLSVTVRTSSAARAEALSTAFLVMGLDKTLEYCEKHHDVGVVMVRRSSQTDEMELVHAGIPRHSLEVLL
jgi:thiamine biosynthesis lipoprotein